MEFNVVTHMRVCLKIVAPGSLSVAEFKTQIAALLPGTHGKLDLLTAISELQDSESMSQYAHDTRLFLLQPEQLLLISPDSRFSLVVPRHCTVAEALQALGLPRTSKLVHSHQVLEETRTFASYGLQKRATIEIGSAEDRVLFISCHSTACSLLPRKENSIRLLEQKIEAIFAVPPEQQTLYFRGKKLSTLTQLSFQETHRTVITVLKPGEILINIETTAKEVVAVAVQPQSSVLEIKQRIQEAIDADSFELLHGDKKLQDSHVLSEIGMAHGSRVQLLFPTEMCVRVGDLHGRAGVFAMCRGDTVQCLLTKAAHFCDEWKTTTGLWQHDRLLPPTTILGNCDISELCLVLQCDIFCTISSLSTSHKVCVPSAASVAEVKASLLRQGVDCEKLLFEGELADEYSLSDYRVSDNSELLAILTFRSYYDHKIMVRRFWDSGISSMNYDAQSKAKCLSGSNGKVLLHGVAIDGEMMLCDIRSDLEPDVFCLLSTQPFVLAVFLSRTLTVPFAQNMTVAGLKERLNSCTGFSPSRMRISWKGTPLMMKTVLAACGIESGDAIDVSLPDGIEVVIRRDTTWSCGIQPNQPIAVLKGEIERVTMVPMPEQRLFFQDRELRDDETCAEIGLSSGSVLRLMGRSDVRVRVCTLLGHFCTLYLPDSSHISEVKSALQRATFVPVRQVRLFRFCELLDDFPIAPFCFLEGTNNKICLQQRQAVASI